MALSKEEIAIRVGVDHKSVNAGLQNLTARLKTFAATQKSIWDQGVAHHAAAEKKKEEQEVVSAIRAAERSNKARRLWRERAEKREAKSVSGIGGQDTISRSVELANKEGKSVFAKASKQLGGYAGNVISGAVMGVVATIASAVTDLITRAVDKLSDYTSKKMYDTLFGISDRMVSYIDEQHSKKMAAKDHSKEIEDENKKLDIAQEVYSYEKKSAEERAKISAERVNESNKEYNLAKKNLNAAKEYQKELVRLNKGSIQATREGLEGVAKAQASLLEARKKSAKAMSDYGKALKDIKVETPKEESVAGNGISPREWTPESGERRFSYAQPSFEGKAIGLAAVDDYMAKIKSGQDAYKAKTDYSQFGKAVAEAQVKASAETVIPVRIVEINEGQKK